MKGSFQSLQQWWDFGKVQIKQFTQQYTHNVTKELTLSLEHLEKEILESQKLAQFTGEIRHMEACSKKKAQLADLLGYRVQGALVRSRFQSIDQMDVPSKYFFSMEKRMGRSVLFMHFAPRMERCCQTPPISVGEQLFFIKTCIEVSLIQGVV